MLHLAQEERCIRHALLALSSYHERYLYQQGHSSEAPFALSQYNQAIKSLISSRGESPHLNLLTCLIFICIEAGHLSSSKLMNILTWVAQILQGNHPSAIGLFRYGYRIIRELRESAEQGSTDIKTGLKPLIRPVELYFHRLGVQILTVSR